MDAETTKKLREEAEGKPAGIAVLVDAPVLRRLLLERELLRLAALRGLDFVQQMLGALGELAKPRDVELMAALERAISEADAS